MEDTTIYDLVRKAEQDDLAGGTTISKYVTFSLRENIDKIDAYLNSKHISGELDSLGREKPFFNIVTAAVNIWYRATDIDRKNIKIRATKAKQTILAYVATSILNDWMRKTNFGSFLNDWGRSLARYGSSVVKFVEKDGELYSEVIAWNRLIIDPIDFENNVVIEILELTPAQLRKRKGYNKNVVEALIKSAGVRKTADGVNKDNKEGYIKLYEVHGELPMSYLTGKDEDDDTYVQQMHVISYVEGKDDGSFDEFTLVSGREAKNPYMITHLIREDGRSQSIGAVEHLFEAQWMMNHTVKSIKDQLDLASKLFFQTADGNFVGQNAISALETGDILIHAVNQPLTQVNNGSHDITSLQNFGSMWKSQGQEIVGTPDSLIGNNAPSGTAWRQIEALQQEAHSLFEQMTENKGLHIEEMMRTYVLPHIMKKLDTSDEVATVLGTHGIDKIERMYIESQSVKNANAINIDNVLNTPVDETLQVTTPEEQASKLKASLQTQGEQRFLKPSGVSDETWKELFEDFEMEVEVDVTGEASNTQADMATLNTAFQTVVSMQGRPMTPEERFFYDKILEKAGSVSPVELSSIPESKTPVQPQEALAGGGTQMGVTAGGA